MPMTRPTAERTKTATLAIILVSYVMIILDTSVVLTDHEPHLDRGS